MKQRSTRLPATWNVDWYFWAGCLSVLIIGAGVIWRRVGNAESTSAPVEIPDRVTVALDAERLANQLGPTDAPVRVVELFDYQCPACAAANAVNWPLLRRRSEEGTVRFTAYDVPLPRHANAIPAAVAAGCVSRYAPRAFWDYRHRLMASQGAWESNPAPQGFFLQLAADVGADTSAVRECVAREGGERGRALANAWRLSSTAGITYSPAWAVNGVPVEWNQVPREIEAALTRARRSARAGDPRALPSGR
jgi:protein-disulfide isomerase